jgi:hypothetical protein
VREIEGAWVSPGYGLKTLSRLLWCEEGTFVLIRAASNRGQASVSLPEDLKISGRTFKHKGIIYFQP